MTESAVNDKPRHIAIATGTRADWGLLSPVAKRLSATPGIRVSVIATNMHLSARHGNTLREISDDGLEVARTVEMWPDAADTDLSGSPRAVAGAAARCLAGMADVLDELRPDMLVILGDRYEMLATATAAALMRVPVVHIAGGEVSEGAIDDSMRHAITKLSALHLTATEPYRRRVIQMGESPDRVITTGAIGVYNIMHEPVMPVEELERFTGLKIDRTTLVVTLHPATLDRLPATEVCGNMLAALDRFPSSNVVITYPNNDAEGNSIIPMIEAYGKANPGRVFVVPSLGRRRYLSILRYAGAVAGNSSSGIVEVPSMGIPTVDIGIRQQGRLAAESVIHCATDTDSIADAIAYALSDQGQRMAAAAINPYYRPDTLAIMADAIATVPLANLSNKHFYDIEY